VLWFFLIRQYGLASYRVTITHASAVAPNYAAQRSALAKQIGLGQIRQGAAARKSAGRSKVVKATV
jgi:predicted transcriptional regulator